ncbi:MAG TPA: hypothetical protein PLM07_02975 [Candidatus Rifleibacterium sp.]|nr:hypothetical protein [Candidatus Rifleibacterium sp.]HPT44848.1 hypothetical protein [Candidatus Rifleibacterium sp.]
MRFKSLTLIIILILLPIALLSAKNIDRWLRLPLHGQPRIIRSPLDEIGQPGSSLHFGYEKQPVKPLENFINRYIPEASSPASSTSEHQLLLRNTMISEELDREAAEALLNPRKITAWPASEAKPLPEKIGPASQSMIATPPAPLPASAPTLIGSISSEFSIPETADGLASSSVATGTP